LTYEQKQILAPVHGEWDNMPAIQRKRLLGLAQGYPKMKPEQQQRIQRRLKDWSKLTPEERTQARKKYEKLKQLPPEKRQEVRKKWQEYQQLPEDKKERLRRSKAKTAETRSAAVTESAKTNPTPPAVESAAPATPPKAEAWPNPWQFDTPRP
jgi:thioesterase domain-containing protein